MNVQGMSASPKMPRTAGTQVVARSIAMRMRRVVPAKTRRPPGRAAFDEERNDALRLSVGHVLPRQGAHSSLALHTNSSRFGRRGRLRVTEDEKSSCGFGD